MFFLRGIGRVWKNFASFPAACGRVRAALVLMPAGRVEAAVKNVWRVISNEKTACNVLTLLIRYILIV